MYLSKIVVSGTACRNPYEMHRVLWRLFPENADANRDFLFRVEQADWTYSEVLMQSVREPEISTSAAQIKARREYSPVLKSGQRLRFMLVANPVKMINDEGGRKNSKGEPKKCRVPFIHEEEQRSWLERKLLNGASLEVLVINPGFPLRFRKAKQNCAGKIQPVNFEGILKVDDPDCMIELVGKGIGPAKAFGCGLLSLARA